MRCCRPCPALNPVKGLEVELNGSAFWLRRKNGGVNIVVGNLVPACPIVSHDGGCEWGWRQRGNAVMDYTSDWGREIITQAGTNENQVSRSWHCWMMRDVFNERGHIHLAHRVRSPGCPTLDRAESPVLAKVVPGIKIANFQSSASPVRGVVPDPSGMATVIRAGSSPGPVATVCIVDTIDFCSSMIEKPEGFPAVGEATIPPADQIQYVRMLGTECGLVSGDHKEPTFGNADIGEGEAYSLESPSSQIGRAKAAVVYLNPLL